MREDQKLRLAEILDGAICENLQDMQKKAKNSIMNELREQMIQGYARLDIVGGEDMTYDPQPVRDELVECIALNDHERFALFLSTKLFSEEQKLKMLMMTFADNHIVPRTWVESLFADVDHQPKSTPGFGGDFIG